MQLKGVFIVTATQTCFGKILKSQGRVTKQVALAPPPPNHCNKNESFVKLCEYIENSEDCQFSISELINNLGRIDPSLNTGSGKHLKRKLKEFYGNSVVFTRLPGLSSIVCFSGYRTATLTEKWYDAKKINEINERNRVVMMLQK